MSFYARCGLRPRLIRRNILRLAWAHSCFHEPAKLAGVRVRRGGDFRLTRLLSLRGDARDFVTREGLGGVTGRNHSTFQAGIAFHF